MEKRVAKRLHDALTAAQRIARYTHGRTFDDYERDDYFRSAVERQFEVLSEALKIAISASAESDILESIPEASKIIGMRNHIAHSYDVLDDEIIWQAAIIHIPKLAEQLEQLLEGSQGLDRA